MTDSKSDSRGIGIFLAFVLIWRGTEAGRSALLADPVRTPGVLNPDVAQATIGRRSASTAGRARSGRRPSTRTALKLEQMREYGVGGEPSDYQEDHLISLELGGHPTDRRNLWPEPDPHATRSTASRTS